MSLSLYMCRPLIYACGQMCKSTTVLPYANQSQNAPLPGEALSVMTQEEQNAVR